MDFRNKGYYWILYGCKWQVAEWNGTYWYKCGGEWGLDDGHLTEIGERVIRPDACEATLDILNVNNSESVVSCDACKHNCLVWNDNHPCASCAEFDNFEQKTDY